MREIFENDNTGKLSHKRFLAVSFALLAVYTVIADKDAWILGEVLGACLAIAGASAYENVKSRKRMIKLETKKGIPKK